MSTGASFWFTTIVASAALATARHSNCYAGAMIHHNPVRPADQDRGGAPRRTRAFWAIATLAILALLLTCALLAVIASRNP